MTEVKEFYDSAIYAETMYSNTYDDGSEVFVVALYKPDTIVQITFWSGREAVNPTDDDDLWTVKMWEDYVNAAHDTYFESSVCGNDQWFDNHYSYDGNMESTMTFEISIYADKADTMGLKYHWWALGPGLT